VWWRLKPPLGAPIDKQEPDARDFAIREWAHQLDHLDFALHRSTWVNPRNLTRTWSVKPYQLAVAQAHGFTVPRTLVSNDASEIESFSDAVGGRVIFKPLTWYADHNANVLYTNELTPDRIRSSAVQLGVCPGIFQERISKKHELRVTCVGQRVFAARIFSQAEHGAALDWRRRQFDVPCEIVSGDLALEAAVLAFHERTGLVFGAYDFIVTPADDLVFLEVNPSGQWLWLEERTKQPITSAVVDFLRENAQPGVEARRPEERHP
jgi:glutathione synthase/RimK-type ligase-like ATP-grasp enzyme